MEETYRIIFGIIGVAGIISLVLRYQLVTRLRYRHPATWEALGRPNPFGLGPSTRETNHTLATDIAVQRFIQKQEYRRLDDVELGRLADIYRIFRVAHLVFFAGVIIFMLMHMPWKLRSE